MGIEVTSANNFGVIDASSGVISNSINTSTTTDNQTVGTNPVLRKGDKGDKGDPGNGIASITLTSTADLVDTYTILFTDGTETTFNVTNGENGEQGAGIQSIEKTSTSGLIDTYTITFTNGNSTTFDVTNGQNGQNGQDGADGQDGEDGYSPSASVSKSNGVSTLTVTDKTGTTTVEILDGEDGQTGATGADGQDGFSPTATVVKNGNKATITITDKNGTTTADVYDGQGGSGTVTDVQVDGVSVVTSGVAEIDLTGKQNVLTAGTDLEIVNNTINFTNASGYTDNTGTVTSVNNVEPVNGNVTLNIPAAQVNSDWDASSGVAQILNKPTIPTVNDGTLTINQGGVFKGSFSANASGNVTVNLDAGGSGGNSRNIGEIVASTTPLTDAGLHLLDGSLISYGSYQGFVDYIADLYNSGDYDDLFETEANWQTSVTTYGVCGKFVYDSTNSTVRLPKISGFIEGTLNDALLGDLTEAGLPNITGTATLTGASNSKLYINTSGAFRKIDSTQNNRIEPNTSTNTYIKQDGFDIDASLSNSIYGNSNTVQPQSIKVLYYIVIANTVKTEIEIDIDEVASDLNGKADTDLGNLSQTGQAIIDAKEDKLRTINVLSTSGTVALTDNSINCIEPTGDVTFTLPTITDNTVFHQILIELNLSTVYTITLGTSKYFNNTAPTISTTGMYNLIYEYDKNTQNWVVGCLPKG